MVLFPVNDRMLRGLFKSNSTFFWPSEMEPGFHLKDSEGRVKLD